MSLLGLWLCYLEGHIKTPPANRCLHYHSLYHNFFCPSTRSFQYDSFQLIPFLSLSLNPLSTIVKYCSSEVCPRLHFFSLTRNRPVSNVLGFGFPTYTKSTSASKIQRHIYTPFTEVHIDIALFLVGLE